MNILITGSSGFIGYHLAKSLLETFPESKVVGIDSQNSYYDVGLKINRNKILEKYSNFKFYKIDILNEDLLSDLFVENTFDFIFHFAAQAGVRYSFSHPDQYIKTNILGTQNIFGLALSHKIKHIFYASSSSVYGNSEKDFFSEEDNTDKPLNIYAYTKKNNELLASFYNNLYQLKSTGFRLFTVYGPYGRPDMALFNFCDSVLSDKPLILNNNGDMERDFTYVDDVIKSIILIFKKKKLNDIDSNNADIFNIGNHFPVNIKCFVEVVEKTIGKKAIVKLSPLSKGESLRTACDTNKLENYIGYRPQTSIEEGIDNFFKWYKEYFNRKGK